MILAILVLLIACAPALAEDQVPGIELRQGDPAPADGAFFSGDSAISLLEALRDAEASRTKLDSLIEEVKAKDGEIADLEASKKSADVAIAKAEVIIENWKLIDGTRKAVVEEYKTALQQVRETNEQLLKSVKEAESKAWWDRVWSTIVVGVVGVFGFLH